MGGWKQVNASATKGFSFGKSSATSAAKAAFSSPFGDDDDDDNDTPFEEALAATNKKRAADSRTQPEQKKPKISLSASLSKSTNVSDIFGDDEEDDSENEEVDTRSTARKMSALEKFKAEIKKSQAQSTPEQRRSTLKQKPVEQTTNIVVNHMPTTMDEQKMMREFGVFGPLASVKIFWPLKGEVYRELMGFVAFMKREDAEGALRKLQGHVIEGNEIQVGWSKPVPIPAKPIYVHNPEEVVKDSGLPFNARPSGRAPLGDPDCLYYAKVDVKIPKERKLRRLIHRTVEYVVKHGPQFEQELMRRTEFHPDYRFLRDYRSREHVYYRWKLFSILNFEKTDEWGTGRFRMYVDGPYFYPPMVDDDEEVEKGHLSIRDRDALEDRVNVLVMEEDLIGDLMYFCISRAYAANEIVEVITKSLSLLETPVPLKVARLYLLSDILHNSTASVAQASQFRTGFWQNLEDIFYQLHRTMKAIKSRLRAEQFRKKVMEVIAVWLDWTIFPEEYLRKLDLIFHTGKIKEKTEEGEKKEEETGDDGKGGESIDSKKGKAKKESHASDGGDESSDDTSMPMPTQAAPTVAAPTLPTSSFAGAGQSGDDSDDDDADDIDGKPLSDEDSDSDDGGIDGKPLDLTDSSDDDDDDDMDGPMVLGELDLVKEDAPVAPVPDASDGAKAASKTVSDVAATALDDDMFAD